MIAFVLIVRAFLWLLVVCIVATIIMIGLIGYLIVLIVREVGKLMQQRRKELVA